MRVLVVDDEPLARRRLCRMLRRLATVTVVQEAEDGPDALARGADFDVVLLDIAMPGIDGLEVAGQLPGTAIAFVTAHPQHALAAFDTSAVDYLVKPVRMARLERALARVVARSQSSPSPGEVSRMVAHAHDGTHLFDPVQIECLWSADKVTSFEVDGREYAVDQSLASLASTLPGFVRVHRSWVVRAAAVVRWVRESGATFVELAGGRRVPVSRRLAADVQAKLGLR